MPRQFATVGSCAHADAELDLVLHQVAQHRVQRPQPLECAEDQPHDVLDLLVRVERHLPGRPPNVASGQRDDERAAAGFAEPPLLHPLLQEVQLGF